MRPSGIKALLEDLRAKGEAPPSKRELLNDLRRSGELIPHKPMMKDKIMPELHSGYETHAEYYFNLISENSFAHEMTWTIVETSKLAQAVTPLGIYTLEVRADRKSYLLRFDGRVCPTRFTATNRAQWEADDHYRRLLAQQKPPARMKPPKW